LGGFQDAFDRYLPPSSSEQSETSATMNRINGLQASPAATTTATDAATDLQQPMG
jgi:hypothetical protein